MCLTDTYFSQCSVASHGGGHFLRQLSANPGCSGEGFLWRRCLGFPRSGAGIGTRRLEGPLCPRGRSHSRSHFLPNCLPSLQIKHTLVKNKKQTSNSFIKKSKKMWKYHIQSAIWHCSHTIKTKYERIHSNKRNASNHWSSDHLLLLKAY